MAKFNLNQALDELQCPYMFKVGLYYHISSNKIKIKSKAEFSNIVKEYANTNLGG